MAKSEANEEKRELKDPIEELRQLYSPLVWTGFCRGENPVATNMFAQLNQSGGSGDLRTGTFDPYVADAWIVDGREYWCRKWVRTSNPLPHPEFPPGQPAPNTPTGWKKNKNPDLSCWNCQWFQPRPLEGGNGSGGGGGSSR